MGKPPAAVAPTRLDSDSNLRIRGRAAAVVAATIDQQPAVGAAHGTVLVDVEAHAQHLRTDPLYLDRCQVDTPDHLVRMVWEFVSQRRRSIRSVVDFGAGDARFARYGSFDEYTGYEIDEKRTRLGAVDDRIRMIHSCAFSHHDQTADLCIGNPPYVRNQDLPLGWRQMAAAEVLERTGVALSGLANAWQYFLMLALWSVSEKGLVAQVVPFEWVSRPAAGPIRDYIRSMGWTIDVYRLRDGVFGGVQTAASITVVDKLGHGDWRFHDVGANGEVQRIPSPTGSKTRVLEYRRVSTEDQPRAKRGLSPGSQRIFTLTEGERVHAGLRIGSDVVPCVTSLRVIPPDLADLSLGTFNKYFRQAGVKCWLIRTDRDPSTRLRAYLAEIDESDYQTSTCLSREQWWRFPMPVSSPQVLVAQAFKGKSPKAVLNEAGAHAVGGVAGIYNVADQSRQVVDLLRATDVQSMVVPYSNGMNKLEINQLNALLSQWESQVPR